MTDPQSDTKLIGGRLRAILDERGISLAWLADRADVSASQLSLLTRGLIRYPRVNTVRKISDALGIAPGELTGQLDWTAGGRPFEGVVIVPVVRLPLKRDGSHVHERGGEAVTVPSSLLGGRERVLAAVIDGAGMSPHVLIGDRVVFDPDGQVRHGTLVLLHRPGLTLAAWYVAASGGPGEPTFQLADGTCLERAGFDLVGTILYIMRTPPAYRPRAAT